MELLENRLKPVKVTDKKRFGKDYFPLEGLSLNFMVDQLAPLNLVDGNSVEEFVYRLTKPKSCSFVELVKASEDYTGCVNDQATYFVSFAYAGSFADLLSALQLFKEKESKDDLYVWLSVFSVNIGFNKGKKQLTSTSWFAETFTKLIPKLGATLFALTPWHEPVTLDRLWCVTELYLTVKSDCELHILLSKADEESFAGELLCDVQGLVNYISKVKVQHAEIGRLKDKTLSVQRRKEVEATREKILAYLASLPGGFEAVNDEIRGRLRVWFARTSDRTLEQNRKLYEKDPRNLCRLLNAVASLYHDQGRLDASEKYFRELIALSRITFKAESPVLGIYLNDAARLLQDKGNQDEAEQFYREALAILRKVYGSENRDVATALSNMGLLLNAQGRYEEAKMVYEESLSIRRSVLGNEHPQVAFSLNNIAGMLYDQGKYEEAKPLFEESLAMRKKFLGYEHPLVANSISNIAALLKRQGKYEEAKKMHEKALAIRRKVLGNEHPHVARSLNNIAELLWAQGKNDEAKPLFEESLAIYRKVLVTEHPHVAESLRNMAYLMRDMGDEKEAKRLGMQAYKIASKVLREDHPNMKTFAYWLDF